MGRIYMKNGHHVTEKIIPLDGSTACSKLGDYIIEITVLFIIEAIWQQFRISVVLRFTKHLIKVLEKYNPPIIDSFLPCS